MGCAIISLLGAGLCLILIFIRSIPPGYTEPGGAASAYVMTNTVLLMVLWPAAIILGIIGLIALLAAQRPK